MKKKLLYSLLAIIACFTLAGCETEKNLEKNSENNIGGIDSTSENVLLCTNLERHMRVRRENVIESWQYVIEYADNNQDILNWKEVYTVDFSQHVNKDHDKLVEYIKSNFCKYRIDDVTEEGYEENEELCQITNKDYVYTAVVTYPDKSIKHFVESANHSFEKETMKNLLETGTYDDGFRGIFTCDKDFNHFTLESYNTEREIQVKFLGSYEYGKEDALIYLTDTLENISEFYYKELLKEYKIDGSESFSFDLKSEDGNDHYTYDVKFECFTENESDCEKYMDAVINKIKENEDDTIYKFIK